MTTIKHPGVYIEELANHSLSVTSGQTAVPAFAAGDDSGVTETRRINSWLDFVNAIGEFNPAKQLHVSLRSYFENGGGYCYIVPTSQLATEIPKLEDITLLVSAGQDINPLVSSLCVDGMGLFAILDGPESEISSEHQGTYPSTSHAAVYYPWLSSDWSKVNIPPGAAVAGAYCSTDRERGAWKAPANVALKGGLRPIFKVSDEQQANYMDGKAINMIREFSRGGTLIWGARTLEESDSWRYIPVRRLFDTVERDIKKALRVTVFEPNNQVTWERSRAAISNYLHGLWQQGGLMGARPEEGYFVQVGSGITMTDEDIQAGKLIVKVGLAAVRPAEFIILQFTQEVGQG